jgi:tRNA-dihydrouridine synthase A
MMESYQELVDFMLPIIDTGCKTFIVHARKAWLKGLSPKQNREIPPLNYDLVYQLKRDMPELEIIINGGITSLEQSKQHLTHVDGVMLGREAYHNPSMLRRVDSELFGCQRSLVEPIDAIRQLYPYIEQQLATDNVRLNHITRHLLGLFQGQRGAKIFRRYISENAHKPNAGIEVLEQALSAVE